MNEVYFEAWKQAIESLAFTGRSEKEIALISFGWAKFLNLDKDLVLKQVACNLSLSIKEMEELYYRAKSLVFKPEPKIQRHKIVSEILELIKIGPVKRQDLIAKFKDKYLVDKALSILEQMGFIQKQVVYHNSRKGGRPFHLYSYVPEGKEGKVKPSKVKKTRFEEIKNEIKSEIKALREEFLRTLYEQQFRPLNPEEQQKQREWYKANAKAYAQLRSIWNRFNPDNNLVIRFTDARIVPFLEEVYGSLKNFFKQGFEDIFWRVFVYFDPDPDGRRVVEHVGRETHLYYEENIDGTRSLKQLPVIYVVDFQEGGKIEKVYSWKKAYKLLNVNEEEVIEL